MFVYLDVWIIHQSFGVGSVNSTKARLLSASDTHPAFFTFELSHVSRKLSDTDRSLQYQWKPWGHCWAQLKTRPEKHSVWEHAQLPESVALESNHCCSLSEISRITLQPLQNPDHSVWRVWITESSKYGSIRPRLGKHECFLFNT